jgi:hypothetical protein
MKTEQPSQKGSIHPGSEIKEDAVFQVWEWRVQRVGWVLLALIALAAALGLFGHGVLSSASLGNGGLHLRYERFERVQRPTTIRLRISPTMGQTASIFIARSYLDAIRIERIMPQPEKTEASARGLIYHFPVKGGPITITFHLEIEQFGVVSGEIGLIDGPTISFNQFVYP